MNSLKHQLLEVVASGVLFNISNPSVPPDVEELFLSQDRSMLVLTLISCWLLFYMCISVSSIKQLPAIKRISDILPEKGWILLSGFLSKILIQVLDLESDLHLSADVVQHLILTTIILHASYRLYHPTCYRRLWTILAMSATNTLLSLAIINILLSKLYAPWLDPELTVFDCLEFSCIICAVGKYSKCLISSHFVILDPSAMLAVMDAESPLYYLVVGQSIFNYGVAYLLLECVNQFTSFSQEEILVNFDLETLGYITASLLVDPLVGGLIGLISALLAMFILKSMSHQPDINFLKPLVILLLAAFGYLISSIFGFSAIICLIVYGLTAEVLTFNNIEVSGNVTVPSIINGLATVLETLLFFYIGFQITSLLASMEEIWQFSLAVLVSITVSRTLVTTLLCLLLNIFGPDDLKISWRWQILIICGGIRGAVSFAMVTQIPEERQDRAEEFHDTTVLIILVTTLSNGILLKILPWLLSMTETENDARNTNKDPEETEK